uniref:Uncharacterized protein n=1 Tax=Anguilla anguilla TaxID=7936 RepID=A0A0E9S603_ANGAN
MMRSCVKPYKRLYRLLRTQSLSLV